MTSALLVFNIKGRLKYFDIDKEIVAILSKYFEESYIYYLTDEEILIKLMKFYNRLKILRLLFTELDEVFSEIKNEKPLEGGFYYRFK